MPSYGQRMQNVIWEKKGVLEACRPGKFSILAWTAKRIAEIAQKSVTYQSADHVVGTLNPDIL